VSRLHAPEGSLEVVEAATHLYASWRCGDSAVWDEVRQDFRSTFPHYSGARYDGQRRAWAVPLHQRRRLATWADAWFSDDAQYWRRGDEDHGHTTDASAARSPVSTLDAAYAVLWLRPGAPAGLVTAAHRYWIRQVHPDIGGSHDQAVAVNQAVEIIERHAPRHSGAA